ncbi:uncharacterized protein MONBRDRAFT_30835 [Monosiga brevicollis MX1]|uniref:ER membrane protein complex subunit 1 n=1 Tax=Monosiga brevicollis TaxID=81824 RepID=A9UPJ8_MONBE|nr:uncharacterized protein MONBRDRAFT_30835 [Monosiga brevicollis MX1]EDQ92436.1 predicted protein [Monosiga brevicollis MX1]|eukprot:XP_001742198.1 hypothetical protein [Monosiga brevicollis MX1]
MLFAESNPVSAFLRRVASTMGDVKALFQPRHDSDLTTDLFRLHKMVLAVDRHGQVYALNSVDGQLAYTLPAPPTQEDLECRLFLLQSATRGSSVIARACHGSSAEDTVTFFDGLTGTPVKTKGLSEQVVADVRGFAVIPSSSAEAQILAVLRRDGSVAFFPEPKVEEQTSTPVYFFILERRVGVLRGYLLVNGTAQPTYELDLAPQGEVVADVAMLPAYQRIASPGEILADKTVLFKYTNPNLLAVATLSPYVKRSAVLTVAIIDTVTGAFVDRVQHDNVRGPACLTMAENWVLYSFRDRKHKRTEIAVTELYDSMGKVAEQGFSSFKRQEPLVLRQSYAFPGFINRLAVTNTALGVTQRNALVGLASGGVLSLPRPMFSARRPAEKGAGAALGLPDYHPLISVSTRSILNYNHTVENLRTIVTAPTGLESTCIVVAFGADIFLTQHSPSKQYDRLNSDFDFVSLTLVLTALVALTFVLSNLAGRKRLAALWI